MVKKKTSKKTNNYHLDDVNACIGLINSIRYSDDAKEKLKFLWEFRIEDVSKTMKTQIRRNSIQNCLEDLQSILDKHTTKQTKPNFIDNE